MGMYNEGEQTEIDMGIISEFNEFRTVQVELDRLLGNKPIKPPKEECTQCHSIDLSWDTDCSATWCNGCGDWARLETDTWTEFDWTEDQRRNET